MVLEHFSALSILTYCAEPAHESIPRAPERFSLKIYQGCLIETNIPSARRPHPRRSEFKHCKEQPEAARAAACLFNKLNDGAGYFSKSHDFFSIKVDCESKF